MDIGIYGNIQGGMSQPLRNNGDRRPFLVDHISSKAVAQSMRSILLILELIMPLFDQIIQYLPHGLA